MDEQTEIKEEQSGDDIEEGNQSETAEIIKQQSERIKELETEKNKRIADDAKKQLSGTAEGGTETKPKFSDEQKASRARIKAVGDASGAPWAKNYE